MMAMPASLGGQIFPYTELGGALRIPDTVPFFLRIPPALLERAVNIF